MSLDPYLLESHKLELGALCLQQHHYRHHHPRKWSNPFTEGGRAPKDEEDEEDDVPLIQRGSGEREREITTN